MQKYLELLKNQIILDIKERLCYRINLISDLVLFTLIYFAVFYLAASGESTAESRFLTLLGYIFWQFNAMALGYSTSIHPPGGIQRDIGTVYPKQIFDHTSDGDPSDDIIDDQCSHHVRHSGILNRCTYFKLFKFSFLFKSIGTDRSQHNRDVRDRPYDRCGRSGREKYRADGYDHSGDDAVFDQHDTDREIQYSSFITVCSRNRNRSDTLFGAAHISAHFPWICGAESPVAGGRSLFF